MTQHATPPACYEPRPVRFLELWTPPGWRIKVYGIAHEGERPRAALVDAAKRAAGERLRGGPTRHETYGVGVLGVHDGRGATQVFLDLWINGNELWHAVWAGRSESPAELAPAPADFNAVCVFDLAIQAFERKAWIECVIGRAEGPNLDAYLARRLDGVA